MHRHNDRYLQSGPGLKYRQLLVQKTKLIVYHVFLALHVRAQHMCKRAMHSVNKTKTTRADCALPQHLRV